MKPRTESFAEGGPFDLGGKLDAAALRDALDRADYSVTGIKALKRDLKSNEGVDLALLDRRTAAIASPFGCLSRLFFLGREVSPTALAEAVAPLPVEQLLAVGLVVRGGDGLRASARIERHGELLVCSDFVSFTNDKPLASDHVLGVGPGAISLAALTPRGAVESVLDVGTGGGIQALLAAKHAERVVATDICPRALNFAAMNARLNGIENIELRRGSFFEPAGDERFERVIANPPFVISPGSRFVYRDGGLGGDAVSEHVVRGAASHLEESGFAALLLNWHHATADDWSERPQAWTQGNGCDIRLMRFDDEDPLSYAASWLRQEEKRDEQSAGRMLDEWVRYYEGTGMKRISLGAVIMRKHSGGRNWTRCDDIPMDISLNACGDQITRIFDAEDLLAGLANERDLLDVRLQLHPGHRVDQSLTIREGGWSATSNKLHLTDGMDFCAQVDVQTMRFLAELDGRRTVREAALPIAAALERDFENVVPICLNMTTRLLRMGLLVQA